MPNHEEPDKPEEPKYEFVPADPADQIFLSYCELESKTERYSIRVKIEKTNLDTVKKVYGKLRVMVML